MIITKDSKLDVAYIAFKKGKVSRTIELQPGILVDFNREGDILGIEVLSVRKVAPALKVKGKRAAA